MFVWRIWFVYEESLVYLLEEFDVFSCWEGLVGLEYSAGEFGVFVGSLMCFVNIWESLMCWFV